MCVEIFCRFCTSGNVNTWEFTELWNKFHYHGDNLQYYNNSYGKLINYVKKLQDPGRVLKLPHSPSKIYTSILFYHPKAKYIANLKINFFMRGMINHLISL